MLTREQTAEAVRPAPRRRGAPKRRATARRLRTRNQPRRQRSVALTVLMTLPLLYSLFPLVWLVINSTKSLDELFSGFGLWFGGDFALWDNIVGVLTYDDGIYGRWFANSLLYVVIGAGGSTLLAALAGYGLAKFDFPGRRAVLAVVLGAVAVPGTALAVPTFLLFSNMGLTNTPWGVLIPLLVTPFGLFLLYSYANEAVPNEVIDAARVDGAGEFRIFFTIVLRLLSPALVSVLLLEVVGAWNNYFLPLIMLSDPSWFPLTVGLNQWNAQGSSAEGDFVAHLVLTGSLLTIVPLVIVFLCLQRFWRSGLAAGSTKG
ncbi:ABC transporter permease [Streptomyces sp. AS58]|uniref:Carbohydrate ABC transporter permease n=1 Tax=Streptomyces cadmiisoli TaxID=2184053 RepID=A0A2Z4JDN6_9ACTN|nr:MULTISPECIES: carbohydrate ABC transporter permease [Streptomyces]AWW43161.1 carbohydrate ABC transporter permease [Streptomyces cadmiisoli]KOV51989.1 ABC transporter permease [Streptomyces sp. AS58]